MITIKCYKYYNEEVLIKITPKVLMTFGVIYLVTDMICVNYKILISSGASISVLISPFVSLVCFTFTTP